MTYVIAIAADLLVAILLVATIATSLKLSGRMKRMKADESAMRATITELLVATDSAERAIAGLRATVTESERALAERLSAAAYHANQLAEQVAAGQAIIGRVAQVADLSRRLGRAAVEAQHAPPERPREGREDPLSTTVLTARDLAARAARRISERAA